MNVADKILSALKQQPELQPYIEKPVRKWAAGKPIPRRMTIGDEPSDRQLRARLDRFFGGLSYRNGKIVVTLPPPLRDTAILEELANALGIERQLPPENFDPATALQRLRLLFPELSTLIGQLADAAEIRRLLSSDRAAEEQLKQLLQTAVALKNANAPITLSKLGATHFGDSKILRSGTLRNLLSLILNTMLNQEDTPENRAQALIEFQVVDNPITSQVTLFGPLELHANGRWNDWISHRFANGEPVTLNSCNVEQVDAVRLPVKTVITSENAAPFHELLQEAPEALLIYTEGNPNTTVRRLLQLLAEAGYTCRHWGDSDADGLRIAAQIANIIPTSLYRCDMDTLRQHHELLKPLSAQQQKRAQQLPENFPFRDELTYTLQHGWLEQEQFRR